jgi:hypothetical protein
MPPGTRSGSDPAWRRGSAARTPGLGEDGPEPTLPWIAHGAKRERPLTMRPAPWDTAAGVIPQQGKGVCV